METAAAMAYKWKESWEGFKSESEMTSRDSKRGLL